MKQKIVSLFLSSLLLLSLLAFPADAAAAYVSISSSGSVIVGNQVKVTINISGSEKIGSWLFSLNYDPAYLEYLSGADSGGGGAVRFSDSLDSGVSSLSKTVTFRTKKIGSTSVTVNSPQIVGFDSLTNMSASSASRNINIVAAPTLSSDNNLSSLTISTGELTPSFAPATTVYTVTVPFEVTRMEVSATANHSAATVSVAPCDLAVGENKIEVKVKAENGNTRIYTITVTRQESELAGATVLWNDQEFSVAYDPTTLTPPEGYTAGTSLWGEKKILSYMAPQNSICIVYLTSEALSDWFIYNETEGTFTRMVTLSGSGAPFVLLTPPAEVEIPAGFLPETVTVGEITIEAYRSVETLPENMYLVYAMASDGTCGFYYYDTDLSTFSTFFEPALPEEENVEAISLGIALEEEKEKSKEMEIVALSLGILCVLLFVAFLLAMIFRRRQRKETEDSREEIAISPSSTLTEVPHEEALPSGEQEKKDPSDVLLMAEDLYGDEKVIKK